VSRHALAHGACAAVFDRYCRDVEKIITWVMGVDDELGEMLHETCLRAHEGVDTLADAERLRPWLVSIAVHVARDCLRKRRTWSSWTSQRRAAYRSPQ
jgi:DNA-directed RNA polymerase specialized sigma24 family protein